ncbi:MULTISPECIES: hypothetical protein [unclassified Geodermatophilus]|uniref:hypothetical protein n=1 Tax=unclassified Geodermatophilus TaxID=2637632 RepID=UPI003EE8993A
MLTVRRGLHRVGGRGLLYEEPKAERSRRTLALPGRLVEALCAHRAAQRQKRIAAGPTWEDNDLVFAQANPTDRVEVGSDGVHPRVVIEVLGHAQMRTTTDT